MKNTGISRPVDALGRLVIPKELRESIHLEDGDRLEIFTDGESIVLRKCELRCLFCKATDNLVAYRNHSVCRSCLSELDALAAQNV